MLLLPTVLSLLVAAVLASSDAQNALYPPGLQPLISRANVLLSAGQFNDAARAYSEALDQSPSDYLLLFKRATAYYSLDRNQNALQDFDKVLELTGNTFDKALLMKGRIYAKEGKWTEARNMIKQYSARVKGDQTAGDLLFAVSEGEAAAKKTAQTQNAKLYQACVEAASEALKTATHSVELRQQRADCALASGDIQQTVGDLIRLTHLTAASTAGFLRIARFSYYLLPPSTQAQSTLKQCLHYDPDSRPCASLHRQLKKFDKSFDKLRTLRESNDWRGVIQHLLGRSEKDAPNAFAHEFDEALDAAALELDLPKDVQQVLVPRKASERRREVVRALCQAYVKIEQARKGERWCDELLSFQLEGAKEDMDGLIGRGEAMMAKEEWEEAVRAFEKAFEASGRSSQDAHQRLQRAQKVLKQSKRKDYYKLLDVARDADERTIKKAYRRAAKTAHPDKGGSEAKMAAVNEAYEVLSNPELRQRFDNGEDPMDPMQQQGGNPFQQGGAFPFAQFFQGGHGGHHGGGPGGFPGGGGFQFHFSHGR